MTNWKPMSEAPKDGTVILVAERDDPNENGFYRWQFNKWTQSECFTSIDEDGNYSIPEATYKAFVFTTDVTPPPGKE